MHLTGGKERGAGDGQRDDDRLQDDGADDPSDDGAGGGSFSLFAEKTSGTSTVAEQQQAGGQEELEALDGFEIAEELEVRGGQSLPDHMPASAVVDEDWQREAHGGGSQQADEEVHVRD